MSKLVRASLTGERKKVAYYLFPFWGRVGMTLNDMCGLLGYKSHSNLSAVRSGAQRIPFEKAHLFIKVFEPVGLDPHVFMSLLFRQHHEQIVIETMTNTGVLRLAA